MALPDSLPPSLGGKGEHNGISSGWIHAPFIPLAVCHDTMRRLGLHGETNQGAGMTIFDAAYTERQARFVAMADDLATRIAPRAATYDRDNSFPFADFEDLKNA